MASIGENVQGTLRSAALSSAGNASITFFLIAFIVWLVVTGRVEAAIKVLRGPKDTIQSNGGPGISPTTSRAPAPVPTAPGNLNA